MVDAPGSQSEEILWETLKTLLAELRPGIHRNYGLITDSAGIMSPVVLYHEDSYMYLSLFLMIF